MAAVSPATFWASIKSPNGARAGENDWDRGSQSKFRLGMPRIPVGAFADYNEPMTSGKFRPEETRVVLDKSRMDLKRPNYRLIGTRNYTVGAFAA